MARKPKTKKQRNPEAEQRRAEEERERAAGNPTAAAERHADKDEAAEMGAEEKLQERIDDLMRRTP